MHNEINDILNQGENCICLDDVQDIYALQGKNAGCSLRLRGKVVLITFLVNDGESEWNQEAKKAAIEMLESACARLMSESRLGKKDFQVTYAYCQVSIPKNLSRRNSKKCVVEVLRQFGYSSVQEYQRHYEKKFLRDETAVTFLFNKSFRSYAYSIDKASGTVEEEHPNGEEYSITSFDANNITGSERTFLHELLHQFGAIDYYYPEVVKIKAEKYLPNSIMNGGETIDDLTRYVIGWDESLSDVAHEFLKSIKLVTVDDVDFARRKEHTDN